MNSLKRYKKDELITAFVELHRQKEELEEQLIIGIVASVLIGLFLGATFR